MSKPRKPPATGTPVQTDEISTDWKTSKRPRGRPKKNAPRTLASHHTPTNPHGHQFLGRANVSPHAQQPEGPAGGSDGADPTQDPGAQQ